MEEKIYDKEKALRDLRALRDLSIMIEDEDIVQILGVNFENSPEYEESRLRILQILKDAKKEIGY